MAHRPEPTTATARTKWNKEHAKTKQSNLNIKRQKIKDFDVSSAMDRYQAEKDGNFDGNLKFGEAKEPENTYAENLDINTDDEFGSLLKDAINTLNKNPNDFNANIAMNGMDFLYSYQNSKIAHDATGVGDTYVNFKPGELDDEGKLVNTVQEDKQLKEEIPIGTTDVNNQTPEDIARDKWLTESRNTPAAKAFAEGTDQQKKDWGNLRWEARKRHKKLFDYNTDKEK